MYHFIGKTFIITETMLVYFWIDYGKSVAAQQQTLEVFVVMFWPIVSSKISKNRSQKKG